MSIAAIIIGINGWEQYTLPLANSIRQHEPNCTRLVIDNMSEPSYPKDIPFPVWRTERLCYSAAINAGKRKLDEWHPYDWYIVLSNDVLCTGPFAYILEGYDDNAVIGPQLWREHGLSWIVGWCVAIPRRVWETVGGWDENFVGSSWEDVSFSTDARLKGFALVEDKELPFVHLDQRQRFSIIPDYWNTEAANVKYFNEKYEGVRVRSNAY